LGWRNGGFTWIYIHAEHHHETEDFRVSQIFTRYSPPRLGSENGDFLLFQQIHKQFELGHISSIFITHGKSGLVQHAMLPRQSRSTSKAGTTRVTRPDGSHDVG